MHVAVGLLMPILLSIGAHTETPSQWNPVAAHNCDTCGLMKMPLWRARACDTLNLKLIPDLMDCDNITCGVHMIRRHKPCCQYGNKLPMLCHQFAMLAVQSTHGIALQMLPHPLQQGIHKRCPAVMAHMTWSWGPSLITACFHHRSTHLT